MTTKRAQLKNPTGLHARPASDFVRAAAGYQSTITVGVVGEAERVDAKSIVMVLSLGLDQSTEVEIAAEGPDAAQAAEALAAFIAGGLGE